MINHRLVRTFFDITINFFDGSLIFFVFAAQHFRIRRTSGRARRRRMSDRRSGARRRRRPSILTNNQRIVRRHMISDPHERERTDVSARRYYRGRTSANRRYIRRMRRQYGRRRRRFRQLDRANRRHDGDGEGRRPTGRQAALFQYYRMRHRHHAQRARRRGQRRTKRRRPHNTIANVRTISVAIRGHAHHINRFAGLRPNSNIRRLVRAN